MPIQTVPLATCQKIRQHIVSALVLPNSENHPRSLSGINDDEPPEPDSLGDLGSLFSLGGMPELETYTPNCNGQWFISAANPGDALMKLPGLKLKSALRLVTYLLRSGTDGMGMVWAVPEMLSTTAHLQKALVKGSAVGVDVLQIPQPNGSLSDVMEALAGDRSPLSFVIASILRRELKELGALGKSCDWSHHRFINALPTQRNWQWRVPTPPKDLSPKVLIYPDNRATTEFFTCRITAPVAIYQHVDQYGANHYRASSTSRAIAIPKKV
ncbi:hypothetical protein JOY44_18470 [Phormidium sp. CLA17]|uniref:hypothetical protein n=1 Tax=Leptolyngbya sp. Cla-17 TaxID=2803751 RepID=UPI001492D1D2|nr:hypothetical protein [Leptolyngbya sp. Cla-17]MBM0743573.1 hypothetical protein [Leptolyngbya sp. Cla-17]